MSDETPESTKSTETTEGTSEDLSTLFTPEEVTAKKETIAATKAEEDRRAALTPEAREAEDKAAADKKAEEEKAKAGAPDKYEAFTMPKDVPVDTEMLSEAEPIFKELNLTQEGAQKLVNFYAEKALVKVAEQSRQAWVETQKQFKETIKNDPMFAKDFDANFEKAQLVYKSEFLSADDRAEIEKYGLADFPPMVRLLKRISEKVSDDEFVQGGTTTGKTPGVLQYNS